MENALIYQNPHWQDGQYKNLWPRQALADLIKKLPLRQIQVLQGVRRSGKSTLFKLLINHLLDSSVSPQRILYINLDDPYFAEAGTNETYVDRIIEVAQKLTKESIDYLFLDEVQSLHLWEKYVKSTYDSQRFKKILVTGSNSSLLEGDFAQLLSGRYLSNKIYPLSLVEMLKTLGLETELDIISNKPTVLGHVDAQLRYGAYPEIVKCPEESLKREILMSYYETLLLKDCVANAGIRDITGFKQLAHYLVSNPTSLYSYNSLAKVIDSTDLTAKDFVHALQSSFAFHEIYAYSFSVKKSIRRQKKAYWIDNGFPGSLAFQFSPNRGKLLENLVFAELVKAGYKIEYLHDNQECDFIAQKDGRVLAIQVCWELSPSNLKREVAGLDLATKKLTCDEACIITYDQETDKNLGHYYAWPFWKYFTRNKSQT